MRGWSERTSGAAHRTESEAGLDADKERGKADGLQAGREGISLVDHCCHSKSRTVTASGVSAALSHSEQRVGSEK